MFIVHIGLSWVNNYCNNCKFLDCEQSPFSSKIYGEERKTEEHKTSECDIRASSSDACATCSSRFLYHARTLTAAHLCGIAFFPNAFSSQTETACSLVSFKNHLPFHCEVRQSLEKVRLNSVEVLF